ncbi:MAG: inositol monophosphatase family protein [Anaerolineae bacterium]
MTRYERWLRVALKVAEEAGAYARQVWGQEHVVQRKGFRDIVTQTDIALEGMILDRLHCAFPDHAVTSEEAGADVEERSVRWLVDPLDGTTNFSLNNPNFSIAIAAVDEGVPVVGVVVDPLRAQTFAAHAGGSATLNGRPLYVSRVGDLAAAVFAFDMPRDPELRRRMWTCVGRFLDQGRTVRALGSAALNMAYVAAGWVDGYFSVHMEPWDQTAPALLVREAGGVVATMSGEQWTPYSPDPLMAANPQLVEKMRKVLKGNGNGVA